MTRSKNSLKAGKLLVLVVLLFVGITIIVSLPNYAFAQVDTAWMRRYNGPGNLGDPAGNTNTNNAKEGLLLPLENLKGRSARDFLKSDGRIDLKAIRESGYQGPLDLKGYNVETDPRTGELVLSPNENARMFSDPDDIYWSPLGSGMNSYVLALAIYDNKLIAGGGFNTAGGVGANHIASWDGSSWSPLGSGINNYGVHALVVYDNRLIAGGGFTTAGGVSANNIASWDGSSWSPLGSGMDYSVAALMVYDNKLIAGGWFTTAGGVGANRIASWDGSTWSPLGSGMGGGDSDTFVYALAVYDNKLFAGGWFTTAGGVSANAIASWDGSFWSPLGSGLGGYYLSVLEMAVYDNQLIVGGYFTTAGGDNAHNIASWDGSSWSPLGSGLNGSVNALVVYDNQLIAGGYFTTAGGDSAKRIASWDGSSWFPLGSGMNNPVDALAVYDSKLIAGGHFTTAGGKSSPYIAQWTKHENNQTPTAYIDSVIPNPSPKGQPVWFYGHGQDSDGNITWYEWTNSSNELLSIDSAFSFWSLPLGVQTIYFRVMDDDSAWSAKASVTVTIQPSNEPPVAEAGGPYFGRAHELIQFSGGSSYDPDGNIVQYDWKFGQWYAPWMDNLGPNPTYRFLYPYWGPVLLRVHDNAGAIDIDTAIAWIFTDSQGWDIHLQAVDIWGKGALCEAYLIVGQDTVARCFAPVGDVSFRHIPVGNYKLAIAGYACDGGTISKSITINLEGGNKELGTVILEYDVPHTIFYVGSETDPVAYYQVDFQSAWDPGTTSDRKVNMVITIYTNLHYCWLAEHSEFWCWSDPAGRISYEDGSGEVSMVPFPSLDWIPYGDWRQLPISYQYLTWFHIADFVMEPNLFKLLVIAIPELFNSYTSQVVYEAGEQPWSCFEQSDQVFVIEQGPCHLMGHRVTVPIDLNEPGLVTVRLFSAFRLMGLFNPNPPYVAVVPVGKNLEWQFEIGSTAKGLTVTGLCPIDLVVTDPQGDTISKGGSQIPSARYFEQDLNGDGELEDQVYIPNALYGEYKVRVIPSPEANPTDSFSIFASADNLTHVLAENVMIRDIPTQPYTFQPLLYLSGDANGSGLIELGDVVYLITYLYKNGPAPNPLLAGDANCSGEVELGDVVYLITYLYKAGPPPSCK